MGGYVQVISVFIILFALGVSAAAPYTYCVAPIKLDVPASNLTLELVQTITRHGDRTTLTLLPGDPRPFFCNLTTFMLPSISQGHASSAPRLYRKNYIVNRQIIPGDCNFGQLTQKGYDQHIALGAQLRALYVDHHKFLSSNLNTQEIYIRSTDIYRTIQSAQANFLGFFPSSGAEQTEVPVVDMYTIDSQNENMYSNDGVCPRFSQLYDQVTSEPAYAKYEQSKAALKQQIAQAFGVSTHELPDWSNLFDAFNVINCYNAALPHGITQQMINEVFEIANWEYNYTLANVELTKLTIGSFAQELVQRIQDKIAGKVTQKYFHYSGHDTTIAPLMTAFGVYDGKWPPYASHSQLELWSDAKGNHFVQVKYQGIAHKLNGCTSTFCPVEQFLKNVAPFIPVPKDCVKHPNAAGVVVN